jgi:multidrug efflux pump subunit AcrB
MARTFLRNAHLLWLSIVLIVVAGTAALLTMPRLEDPRIVNRNPIVVTAAPGASAERVQSLVTVPIERALQDVSEIDELSSSSRAGVSVVSIALLPEVTSGQNERIFSKIRDRLGDVVPDLPPEAQAPVLEDQRDPAAYTLIVSLGPGEAGSASLNLLNRLAEDLAERMRRQSGTEIVEIYGAPDEEIVVEIDPAEVAELGLEPGEIATRLAAADSRRAAGILRPQDYDVTIEVDGAFDAVARIRAVPLAAAGDGAVLRLGEVATVERRLREPPQQIARVDGERRVLLAARADAGVQVDTWAAEARALVDDYRDGIGRNVAIATVFDQSVYTVDRLLELASNLALGALVVVLVVMATMGWRAGLIVGAQLPLVGLGALWLIATAGGALHQMSIFGMIIALGLLVDNAIVMVDKVTRGLKAGEDPEAAVARAQRLLFPPLLASTLTTVLAFAPIPMLTGAAGDFVGWIGGSVIVTIVLSFLTAQTVVPALSGRLLPGHLERGPLHAGFTWRRGLKGFRRVLDYALRRPLLALPVIVAPALAGFAIAPTLGNQFFPLVDRNMFDVRVWLPQSASIERTDAVVRAIDARLQDEDSVERTSWVVGASHPPVYYNLIENQDRSPFYAQGQVRVGTAAEADRLVRALQAEFDRTVPEARVLLREYGQGPPIFADIQYRLLGRDPQQLKAVGERMRQALQAHPDVLHTGMTTARGVPKLWLVPDEDEAQLAGLSLGDLAGQLSGALEGRTGGQVLEGLADLPVRVQWSQAARGDLDAVASTPVVRPGAGPGADADGRVDWSPLEAFGRFDLRPETPSLARFDRLTANTVEAYVVNEGLPITVSAEVRAGLEAEGFALPPGVSLVEGGAAEQSGDAVGRLLGNVPPLAVVMIGALILVFRSVWKAALMTSVAALIVGIGFLTTWAAGFPFSFNMILGILGLIGVGLNDSIVVLSEIGEEDPEGTGDPTLVGQAVTNVLRHVVSTTLTTIGGFLPLLLLVGGDFWPSLAIVLATGIPFATLLSIGFVPATYVLVTRGRAARAA